MDAREQGFAVPDRMYGLAMDFLLRGLQEGVSKLPAQSAAPPRPDEIFRDRDNGRFDVLAYGGYVLGRERKTPLATLPQLYDSRGPAPTRPTGRAQGLTPLTPPPPIPRSAF